MIAAPPSLGCLETLPKVVAGPPIRSRTRPSMIRPAALTLIYQMAVNLLGWMVCALDPGEDGAAQSYEETGRGAGPAARSGPWSSDRPLSWPRPQAAEHKLA